MVAGRVSRDIFGLPEDACGRDDHREYSGGPRHVVALLKGVGEWVREQGIPPFYDEGKQGQELMAAGGLVNYA